MHGAIAEDVEVEMIDSLAAIGAVVEDDAITVAQSCLFGDGFDGQQQMTEEVFIFGFRSGELGDGLFGDNQDVGGCLGVNVVEG